MKVNLVVVEGVHQGKLIPLNSERFEIGRGEECQLRPKSPTVSIRHCAIVRRGKNVLVEDLGSTNGTLVNERCLRMGDELRVGDGDRLQVGQLIFVFQIDSGPKDDAGGVEDWLASERLSTPPPDVDMNSRTLLMGSPVAIEPSAAAVVNERLPSPSPDTVKFAYRVFDERRKVVVLGLSQDQLDDDNGIRSLHKTLFGLVTKNKVRRMVLDLSTVDSLPSMACATLLALARQCGQVNGELRLCGSSQTVKHLVTALKFDAIMSSFDNKDDAIVEPWQ